MKYYKYSFFLKYRINLILFVKYDINMFCVVHSLILSLIICFIALVDPEFFKLLKTILSESGRKNSNSVV